MFTLQGNFQLNFEVIGISYLCPSWCPLIIAIHETKFEIEEENTKLKMVMKLPLRPLLFSAFKWSAGQFSQIVKTFEDFTEKIEENQRQSQVITGERLPLWSLSLITIIILIIFTTANNSPNLAHCFLTVFSDLRKRKHKHFLEKHYASACANVEQKPFRASLNTLYQNTFLNVSCLTS